jgi:hypothetical protein
VEALAQSDRRNLRLRQDQPHFSFAQLFFDLAEEIAALKASVAHRKSQGAIEARIIQGQERIECREARWLPRTAIREQCGELIANVATGAYTGKRDEVACGASAGRQSLRVS